MDAIQIYFRRVPSGDKTFSRFEKGGLPLLKRKVQYTFPTPIKWKEYQLYPAFFFPRENQKCPWKPFLAFFRLFSRKATPLSRTLFSLFSRTLFGFHGHFWSLFCFFTGTFLFSRTLFFSFFFHGCVFSFSRALFVFFFTEGKSIFTGKKKTLSSSSRLVLEGAS